MLTPPKDNQEALIRMLAFLPSFRLDELIDYAYQHKFHYSDKREVYVLLEAKLFRTQNPIIVLYTPSSIKADIQQYWTKLEYDACFLGHAGFLSVMHEVALMQLLFRLKENIFNSTFSVIGACHEALPQDRAAAHYEYFCLEEVRSLKRLLEAGASSELPRMNFWQHWTLGDTCCLLYRLDSLKFKNVFAYIHSVDLSAFKIEFPVVSTLEIELQTNKPLKDPCRVRLFSPSCLSVMQAGAAKLCFSPDHDFLCVLKKAIQRDINQSSGRNQFQRIVGDSSGGRVFIDGSPVAELRGEQSGDSFQEVLLTRLSPDENVRRALVALDDIIMAPDKEWRVFCIEKYQTVFASMYAECLENFPMEVHLISQSQGAVKLIVKSSYYDPGSPNRRAHILISEFTVAPLSASSVLSDAIFLLDGATLTLNSVSIMIQPWLCRPVVDADEGFRIRPSSGPMPRLDLCSS